MIRKFIVAKLFIGILLYAGPLLGQKVCTLAGMEDSLKTISRTMAADSSDSVKMEINRRFLSLLQKTLEMPGSMDYPFDSLKMLGKLRSPDGKFRIYNWNLPRSDGSGICYGLLQVQHKGSDRIPVFLLTDRSDSIANAEYAVTGPSSWYGSLYYRVIPKRSSDAKDYYTLLGWNPVNPIISRKVIEVITFDEKGVPVFGAKIFPNYNEGQNRRVIFTFSASARMALKYDEVTLPPGSRAAKMLKHEGISGKKFSMIIFDRLVPLDPEQTNLYQFYVPSADVYDGMIFHKMSWHFIPEIDARNDSRR
jgi:hypothetical protein